jgi:hypothetical protein
MPALPGGSERRERATFVVLSALLVLGAWALRYYYVSVTEFGELLQGDAQRYLFYAVNLLRHGVFSGTPIWLEPIEPDGFRAPGFPALFALAIRVTGEEGDWLTLMMHWHALLGAFTVLLAIVLARHFLPRSAALVVGALAAVWPHHVVFSGEMLVEILFGATVAVSLLALCAAERWRRPAVGIVAGLAGGAAWLVNPIWLFVPAIAAALIAWRGQRAVALAIVAGLVVAPLAWSVRNAPLDDAHGGGARVRMNFVQGSWPQYHRAYQTRDVNEISRRISDEIDAEIELLGADPAAGFRRIATRLAETPGDYAAWYLWHKPYLLWGWHIGLGVGDVYVARVKHSPFETVPPLIAVKAVLKHANPVLFVLAVIGAVAALWRSRRRGGEFAALLFAVTFVYVTAVHVVLQAEPRYSVPFRFVEITLAAYACVVLVRRYARRREGETGDAA